MEAAEDFAEDFIALPDTGLRETRCVGTVEGSAVEGALSLLRAATPTAVEDAAAMGFQAAADFAGKVEELSRLMDYWQLVAAGAVERTRAEAAAGASSRGAGGATWTTGWREDTGAGTSLPGDAGDAAPGQPPSVLDDGYRNTTEFLRARLQIKAAEARNRLRLAGRLLPRPGLAGNVLPPVHEELAAAVAGGEVSACSAGLAVAALDRAGLFCGAEALAGMEHALTRTAAENDPDFLARVAQGWAEALDPDGAEPSEELLRQLQGAFIRKPRHGLRHLEIFATAEQFEHLLTVMNTATNPRAGSAGPSAAVPAAVPAHPAARPAAVPTAAPAHPAARPGPPAAVPALPAARPGPPAARRRLSPVMRRRVASNSTSVPARKNSSTPS